LKTVPKCHPCRRAAKVLTLPETNLWSDSLEKPIFKSDPKVGASMDGADVFHLDVNIFWRLVRFGGSVWCRSSFGASGCSADPSSVTGWCGNEMHNVGTIRQFVRLVSCDWSVS
jgi:hypothetical protein